MEPQLSMSLKSLLDHRRPLLLNAAYTYCSFGRSHKVRGHDGFRQPQRSVSFAADREHADWTNTDASRQIRDLLHYYGLKKWGFTIYRCTYEDDSAWSRFMDHLNKRAHQYLVDELRSPELYKQLNWNIQQDPKLDCASKDEVRRRFRRWIAFSAPEEFPPDMQNSPRLLGLYEDNPRFNYCIHVDADVVGSVVNCDPSLDNSGLQKLGYVNLVRADEMWDYYTSERHVLAARTMPSKRKVADPLDEGEIEVEGCRLSDVGWMKVSTEFLIPDFYALLSDKNMWDIHYCRPPDRICPNIESFRT